MQSVEGRGQRAKGTGQVLRSVARSAWQFTKKGHRKWVQAAGSPEGLLLHPSPCLSTFLFHHLSWKFTMAVLGPLVLSMYQVLLVLSPVSSLESY